MDEIYKLIRAIVTKFEPQSENDFQEMDPFFGASKW